MKTKVNAGGAKPANKTRGGPVGLRPNGEGVLKGEPRVRGGPDSVFETLRARIASHQLPPGSKLRENELAAEFGVSRTRVRDVFGALEQRGLIERIPNRGAIVTRLELKQASDLYDVREYLEALSVKRATINAPEGAWDDLVEKIASLSLGEMDDHSFELYLGYL
jgi:DNA-binding GntR family transcriptional regulator